MLTKFRGIFPPVPTIVNEDGSLDRSGMATLLDSVIDAGAQGVLILGSGGEFPHFSAEQRKAVAAFCLEHVNGRLPVMVGIACPGTQETIELGHHAQQHGADAVLVVNPFYAKLSDEARFQHFRTIAEALDIPLFLYNFPELTGQDIGIEVIVRLAREVPNVVGIKDTVDCLSHIRETINQVHAFRPEFVVFSGYDEYLLDTLILGGQGGIPSTFNFAPALTGGIWRAFEQKEYETAFRYQRQLTKLSPLFALEQPFFSVIKTAVNLCGVAVSTAVVAPSLPLSAEKASRVREILMQAGVLK